MSLASNSLFATLVEFKERADISATESAYNDTRLEHHLDAVSQFIEDYLNRKIITPAAAITETFAGDGTYCYYPKNQPIVSSTDPTLHYWDGDSWYSVPATIYAWSYDTTWNGRVYFTEGDTFFRYGQAGFQNWKLTYLYGYTASTVPEAIKMAAVELALRSMKLMDKTGLSSEGFGDSTTSYNLALAMPDNIRLLLNKYRRIAIG